MEIFNVKNTKYLPLCPTCGEIIKFNINYINFTVKVECRNGHKKSNIPFDIFNKTYIKNSNYFKCYCYSCFNTLYDEDLNYICQICNKLFCNKCINIHKQEESHDSKIKFIHEYKLCQKHQKNYSLFCETCKIFLCSKCKSSHKNHSIKLILDIIPNKKTKESLENKLKIYEKKINSILYLIENYFKKIEKRFLELNNFLIFLKYINNKLLTNYNYSYFDYYNFENFNYLLNSLNNEEIFDKERYINYILMKDYKPKKYNRYKSLFNKKENKNNIENISDFRKLKYLKDDKFYIYENQYIKIYEYKKVSINLILSYNLKHYDIQDISAAKYNNYLLMNTKNNSIKFLEYDFLNRTIELLKKQIIDKTMTYPYYFDDYFDNKNGDVITLFKDNINVWRYKKENNTFLKIKEINNINDLILHLFNINSNIFCIQILDKNIKFYDSEEYLCIKTINYNKEIEYIGTINNQVVLFNNKKTYIFFIIDIKYLEIVQTFELKNNNNYRPEIVILNNYLISIYEEYKEIIINKRKYNLNEKCFEEKDIKIGDNTIKMEYLSNILTTDNGYLALTNTYNIFFIHFD